MRAPSSPPYFLMAPAQLKNARTQSDSDGAIGTCTYSFPKPGTPPPPVKRRNGAMPWRVSAAAKFLGHPRGHPTPLQPWSPQRKAHGSRPARAALFDQSTGWGWPDVTSFFPVSLQCRMFDLMGAHNSDFEFYINTSSYFSFKISHLMIFKISEIWPWIKNERLLTSRIFSY